jgi:hypothetical protein
MSQNRLALNFSTGSAPDVGADLFKALGNAQDRLAKEKELEQNNRYKNATLSLQQAQNQMAREGLDLRRQGMTLQEQEAERRAGIDTAKLVMQADAAEAQAAQNIWAKKNAGKQLSIAEQSMLNAEAERQYKREMEAGRIYGGSIPLETQRPGEDKVEMKDIETLGYTPVEPSKVEVLKAYDEYKSKISKDYDKGTLAKIGSGYMKDVTKDMVTIDGKPVFAPRAIPGYGIVKDYITDPILSAITKDSSEKADIQKQIADESKVKAPKEMSLEEFSDYFKKEKYNKPSQSYRDLPKLQKEVRTPTVVDVSEKELYEQGNKDLEAYFQAMKQQGKTPTDAQVLGAKLEIQKRINGVLDTRKLEAKDARDLTTFVFKEDYKNLKTTEQKAYLEQLKSELNRTNDALKAKKLMLEIAELEKNS